MYENLKIEGTNFVYFSHGAYAVIFLDEENSKIRKVFLDNDPENKCQKLKTFKYETDAYEISSANDELKGYIPRYYGKLGDQKIVDQNGNDQSGLFLSNCGYETEFINKQFYGIHEASEQERKKINNLFSKYDITYLLDASVCLSDNDEILKIIDFATREEEPQW